MDYTSKIAVGMTHEAVDTVTDANTALTVGSGSLAVYATPAMAALMERAAAELCQQECSEGWTTVGASLNILSGPASSGAPRGRTGSTPSTPTTPDESPPLRWKPS